METRGRLRLISAMPPRAMSVISSQMRWKDHFSIACFLSQTSVGKRIVARRYARPPRSRSALLSHARLLSRFRILASAVVLPDCKMVPTNDGRLRITERAS
jgi:hypothetical protein